MPIINILRNIWTRYGGGLNSLSRAEQVEILHVYGPSRSRSVFSPASPCFS